MNWTGRTVTLPTGRSGVVIAVKLEVKYDDAPNDTVLIDERLATPVDLSLDEARALMAMNEAQA